MWTVEALLDESADIVEAYAYRAYGEPTIKTADGGDGDWFDGDETTSTSSAFGNCILFTGRQYDPETGMYYYRARIYDPVRGRFISADPIGYEDGMNLYGFLASNPFVHVDPLGLACRALHVAGNADIIPEDGSPATKGEFTTGWGIFTHTYEYQTNMVITSTKKSQNRYTVTAYTIVTVIRKDWHDITYNRDTYMAIGLAEGSYSCRLKCKNGRDVCVADVVGAEAPKTDGPVEVLSAIIAKSGENTLTAVTAYSIVPDGASSGMTIGYADVGVNIKFPQDAKAKDSRSVDLKFDCESAK